MISASCHASSSYLSLQHSNNYEDLVDLFLYASIGISAHESLLFSLGKSNLEETPTMTIETDYYSIGYTSMPKESMRVSAHYNHWNIRDTLLSDTYSRELSWYIDNWRIGVLPEFRHIAFENSLSTLSIGYRSRGMGLSAGYSFENLSLYATNTRAVPLRFHVSPQLRRFLRLASRHLLSELDESRTSIGAEYYFDTIAITLDQDNINPAFTGSEYRFTTASGQISFMHHWQASASVSHYGNDLDELYSTTITSHW